MGFILKVICGDKLLQLIYHSLYAILYLFSKHDSILWTPALATSFCS
jgi:hypothetical protein